MIINNLNKLDVKTASLSSKTICDLQHASPQRNIVSDASVYCTPCRNFKLRYIGETLLEPSRSLERKQTKH